MTAATKWKRILEVGFDPDDHRYAVDGRILPGVNDILQDVGIIDDRWYTEFSRDRGTAVHTALASYDRGRLDLDHYEKEVIPVLGNHLAGWIDFLRDHEFVPELIEERVTSKTYDYCGTLDRFGPRRGTPTLLDIKTGATSWVHGLQLGAYEHAAGETFEDFPVLVDRLVVQLTAEGKYKLKPMEDFSDRDVFLSAAAVVNAKRRHA